MFRTSKPAQGLALIAIFTITIYLAGCARNGGSSTLTKSKYDQITDGMSLKDVEAIFGPGQKLGNPYEQIAKGNPATGQGPAGAQGSLPGTDDKSDTMNWQDGQTIIVVQFVDGKVVGKAQSGLFDLPVQATP